MSGQSQEVGQKTSEEVVIINYSGAYDIGMAFGIMPSVFVIQDTKGVYKHMHVEPFFPLRLLKKKIGSFLRKIYQKTLT